MRILDISLEITPAMMVYPGNPRPLVVPYAEIPRNPTNESVLVLGSHTGSHVDAHRHVQPGGSGAAAIPLDQCCGPCRVLDLTGAGPEIRRAHLELHQPTRNEIILLKTENARHGYDRFREDFAHVTMEAACYLIACGVKALGADYLSVKKYHADADVHERLITRLTLYEGLDLRAVAPGAYFFAGFPLRVDADGSPIRAVLIDFEA